MTVRCCIAVVALAACGPRVLTDWRDTTPPAPCEVIEANDAGARISKYSAEGRLLFSLWHSSDGDDTYEYITWNDDRIARRDTYRSSPSRRGECLTLDGCNMPDVRTVESSEYHWDDASGLLIAIANEKREYWQRGAQWREHDVKNDELRYGYNDRGQLVAIDGGDIEFSFEYEMFNRPSREVIASKHDDNPITIEWVYDGDGRVKSETRRTRSEERVTTWTYDENGRVISGTHDGRVSHTFQYSASCPANLPKMRPSEERFIVPERRLQSDS
ncbi:MAG: RHS repeat protein [Kofleriaceae bacterium]|nr:RHS repeat protein [Kofleriaceae bacterium]